MENQYCKVGSVKSVNNEEHSVVLMEYLYQNFIEKSSNIQYANTKLGEFFESKAQKFEKLLKNL
tara:strand:- start:2907 stop:3098 length:192 start_codon:yes stop_codon:yes gene_type:complete